MHDDQIVHTIFLIFSGAAVVATLALYARQALLIAYILLGVLMGPSAIGLVGDPEVVQDIAHVGIMFLLFLMGLELNPHELLNLLRKTTWVTLLSSLIFWLVGALIALGSGLQGWESALVGAAMLFSSTIIGLKLLPTTILHHQRTGEIIISILLLQDLIAILLLLVIEGSGEQSQALMEVGKLVVALPLLIMAAMLLVRFLLLRFLRDFDTIHEYIFLLSIGWCLGVAEAAKALGLSSEIGAFIAGVTLATNPIALYMAENLKPLRDFFLVMFFFSLGAGFDLSMLAAVILPSLILVGAMMLLKPWVFRMLLVRLGEEPSRSAEIGMRLGQMSEFSLLIAVLAFEQGLLSITASYLIQLATVLSFLLSTYLVVSRYPTPIALSDKLRRN
ncbi:MAG: cation:proton antiporter [Gammaproteobacteria bacterium]|nr:cation:proton antiporter [Gammaproteobacteria bacterium]